MILCNEGCSLVNFQNVRLLSISEQVADYIKQSILKGELKPGQKLPTEHELADQFQVSRPTIRDAIKILSSMKMITSKPGVKGGHYISSITKEWITNNIGDFITLSLGIHGLKLSEVIEMRKMVEVKAAYLAALRRKDEDLQTILEHIQVLKESQSDLSFYKRDFEFHRCIALATYNRLIIISIDSITLAIAPLFKATECPSFLKDELIDELHSIYLAIKDQNPDLAAKRMHIHLNHFETYFENHNE